MLASIVAAAPAQAQSVEELKERNRLLEEENARLRAALAGPSIAKTPVAPGEEPRAQPQPFRSAHISEKREETVGDAELVDAITATAARIKELPKSVSAVTGEELETFHVNNCRRAGCRRLRQWRTGLQAALSSGLLCCLRARS
ncbi:hypothetical protein [Sphingopyxis sp.]|uniref:hypothetical protein n=1 Tax=Sphingopyxis sp. TaxID=1908224 RepID=UPI002D7EB64D|nr:hypothetical protein [Sphingopyxis sp.]